MGGAEAPGDEPDVLRSLYQAHYPSLVRLAALLTADALLAEEIAADSLAAVINSAVGSGAPERILFLLRRHVVLRCRRATRDDRAGRRGQHVKGAAPPTPDRSRVLQALRQLPAGQREALILRHYLDLSERETAAITGASLRAVRRSMAAVSEAFLAVIADGTHGTADS